MSQVQKVSVLGMVDYAAVDYNSASDLIIANAVLNHSYGVFALPVHGLITAINEPAFLEATKKADLIVPDGHPIRWFMNFFYKTKLKDRVYGPELTKFVLHKANEKGLRIFLYGGSTQTTLDKFNQYISENFPNITVCGTYREPEADSETLFAEQLMECQPHIVLVGRGCPRQELWIAKNLDKVNAVMMGIGAAFSFYSGTLKQAPKWMQDNGLEWLFRLSVEPNRLFKRYFLTNSQFIFEVLKYSLLARKN